MWDLAPDCASMEDWAVPEWQEESRFDISDAKDKADKQGVDKVAGRISRSTQQHSLNYDEKTGEWEADMSPVTGADQLLQ